MASGKPFVGERVFINMDCIFQDQGGITLDEGALMRHNVVLATINHDLDTAKRQSMSYAPIHIGISAMVHVTAIRLSPYPSTSPPNCKMQART